MAQWILGVDMEYTGSGLIVERQEIQTADGGWERLVTGIVADPENVDVYGGTIDEDEIRNAMIGYMENYMYLGKEHEKDADGNRIALNTMSIVECWQTRERGIIGDSIVPKGAWVMTLRINDLDIWQNIVDGAYTGFSFEALLTEEGYGN